MTMHASSAYSTFTADIKKTFSGGYLEAQRALGVNVRHYRAWDHTDLLALYDSFFGRQIFIHLAQLMGEAQREAELRQGTSYDSLAPAQQALESIAPTGLDWQGYTQLMSAAVAEIKERSRRMTDDLAALFAADMASFGTRQHEPASGFDQQAALAAMDAHMSAVHTETAPARSTVASLKNFFTRAAS